MKDQNTETKPAASEPSQHESDSVQKVVMQGQFKARIIQTFFDGSRTITECRSSDENEAKSRVLRLAKDLGWEPPKWWEFWRTHDTKLDDLA